MNRGKLSKKHWIPKMKQENEDLKQEVENLRKDVKKLKNVIGIKDNEMSFWIGKYRKLKENWIVKLFVRR